MEYIDIHDKYGEWKIYNESLWYCGNVFQGNQRLKSEQLYFKIESALINNGLSAFLNSLNGFYTIIFKLNSQELYIISDIVRSYPLFYTANARGNFLISDYIEKLFTSEKVEYNENSKIEFSKTGYVTGSDTFLENISQTQAAEVVHVKDGNISNFFYYYFYPVNGLKNRISTDAFFERLDDALLNAFKRLQIIAKGKQIVIPLSGGYDSRILALYVKKLKFENVIAFTFGSENSPEVKISKNVAEVLSFDWHFVKYTNAKWAKLKKDPVFIEYLQFICSYSSLPNIMVFPAILELSKKGVIEKDAVVIPGHTGDFIVGGHIPKYLLKKADEFQDSVLRKVIFEKHFSYSPSIQVNNEIHNKIKGQIAALSSHIGGDRNVISMFESWEWKERQTKFIVNSNRYYDFLHLNWWMPLWDREVVGFWEKASLAKRTNGRLWPEFIKLQFIEYLSDEEYDKRFTNIAPNRIFNKIGRKFIYFNHDLRIFGLIPLHKWLFLKNRFSSRAFFQYLIDNVFHLVYPRK